VTRYAAVRPDDDQVAWPGRRLRISRYQFDDSIAIHDETVLPERVDRLDANRITPHSYINLTTDEARWLHARLGEILQEVPDGSA
jgi:hypothetical protein